MKQVSVAMHDIKVMTCTAAHHQVVLKTYLGFNWGEPTSSIRLSSQTLKLSATPNWY